MHCTHSPSTAQVGFNGWARMAKNLEGFTITEVQPPKVGEMRPAAVSAEVVVDLSCEWRAGWTGVAYCLFMGE